ncbi:MAG: 4-hydroxy-tetrahydrodipicolinate synthase [Frankiales bacterium]|nr:4-hydroxy-tetrahydrodipicolinate synthase [Frankiales bacterium]
MSLEIAGLYPSVVLPLREDLSVATRDYVVQVQHLARVGRDVAGVVVNDPAVGGGGLDREERASVLALARAAAPTGFPIVACIDADTIETAAGLLQDARDEGADAVLVRPLSASAVDPCAALAELAGVSGLPLLVGQARNGTAGSYPTQVLAALSRLPAVSGIVSAVNDVGLHAEQYAAVDRRVPVLVSAEGPQLLALLQAGAEGAVLGVSNIAPRAWARFVADVRSGHLEEAEAWYESVGLPLLTGLAASTDRDGTSGAAWVKQGLVLLGQHANARVRAPQSALAGPDVALVHMSLVSAGLLVA